MSKREEEKVVEAATRVAEQTRNVTQESINVSLDETKRNIRKSINETRTQIPQYTNVVKNYQEQALESTDKIMEDYIETQKAVINSVYDTTIPYYENVQRMYNFWLSPRVPTELWARSVSNIAENVSAATRINNDILFGNIDAYGNAFERVQRQTEELSRINANNAKTIANTAKQTAAEFSNNREVYR
jgi:inorganic triphosphatase YgiF